MNNALREQWQRAGYRTNMGSAAVIGPPPIGFVRVYHLTAAEYAISNIALSRLKVARFSDLNDPFELMALNLRERRVRHIARDFKDAYGSLTGLLCFSADWTEPVLWSHYGAKHRGICLGFDLKRTLANRVQYADKRLKAELGESESPDKLDDKLQKKLMRTKSSNWKYEKEYRVFVSLESAPREGALNFRPFDETLRLAEVILGPQCSLSLDGVRSLVSAHHPHAVTFKARLAFKWFKVVPDERTVRELHSR